MKRGLIISAAMIFFLVTETQAARPGRWLRSRTHVQRVAPTYDQTYRYLNWRYPKYTGGFHANYFRDMGVPPGDVGIRGNGIYLSPW